MAVTLRVTTDAIARASTERVVIRAATNAQRQRSVETISNAPGAEPLARVSPNVRAVFAAGFFEEGVVVIPQYAGLAPGFVRLYQLNVTVPENAPRGTNVTLFLSGLEHVSNRVQIAIE